MKERLTKNLGLKLLSLGLAFVVWLVVVNISNPEVVRTKTVQLEILNEQIISNAAKTYNIIGSNTITVSYTVRTRDEYSIKTSDFRAYADLSNLYNITGSVPVTVDVLNNKDLIIGTAVAKPSVVRIETEDIQKKTFDLSTKAEGTPIEGTTVGTVSIDPTYVTVTGPISVIGQINSMGVKIDVDGISEDKSGQTTPVFYDANGNIITIDDRRLSVEPKTVDYVVTMLKGKSLVLDFKVSGEVANGYRYIGAESNVKSISVLGLKSVLAGLTTVEIPETALNVDGISADKTVDVNVSDYLPDNVKAADDSNISVTLKVEALNKKSYVLNLDDIETVGHTYGYSYALKPFEITVVLTGLQEDLDTLNASDLNAKIDYTHLSKGVYPGILTCSLPEGIEIESYTPFDIAVSDLNDNKQEETTATASTTASTDGDESVSFDNSQNETTQESNNDITSETSKETSNAIIAPN